MNWWQSTITKPVIRNYRETFHIKCKGFSFTLRRSTQHKVQNTRGLNSEELQVWTRILLLGIGFVVPAMGIAIACVLDREAGAFECPECKERFVPDMKSYVMGPHTITKRKLTCPKCGCTKYCKHVLTR